MYEARMSDECSGLLLAESTVDSVCQDHLSDVLHKRTKVHISRKK